MGRPTLNKEELEYRRSIGWKIRQKRKEKGIKQYHLAEEAGMLGSVLSRVEKGEMSVGIVQLMQIAKAMGEGMEWINTITREALRESGWEA